MESSKEYTWHLAKVKEETPQIKSLFLEADDVRPDFIAGQYLTIKIPGLGPVEGKAYSISSAPFEKQIRISVKKIGTFSSALLALQSGSTIHTSAPYGFFYPELEDNTSLVFLAGGIGITPILSIIHDLTHRKDTRPLHLFYSNQIERDIAFRGELEELASKNPHLHIHYFITRETLVTDGHITGRMEPSHIMRFVPEAVTADYFLCGAMSFTKSLWKSLREHNIKQYQIYTEGFF